MVVAVSFFHYNTVVKKSLRELFEKRVVRQGECAVWQGLVTTRGLGVLPFRGTLRTARSVALELAGRKTERGQYAHPTCGNPLCVKPEHLEVTHCGKTAKDYVQRFWSKVEKRGPYECWLWQAYCDPRGYGRFPPPKGRGEQQAHRIAYVLSFGPIPPGQQVLHKCDNPPCVNPNHLRSGTDCENQQDKVAKRRHVFGERCRLAKLVDAQAQDILRRGLAGERTGKLAQEYGVSKNTIRGIVKRRTWRHLS